MIMRLSHQSGQLLLPILGVLFLFGLFWVTYVFWCRMVYWKMKMDVAADAAALSASRQQATILNYVATIQTLENAFLPEIKGYGIMDVSVKGDFEGLNDLLQLYEESYAIQVPLVAQIVAKANGGNSPVLPTLDGSLADNTDPQLEPHAVHVHYVADGWFPVGGRSYPKAYYTRRWSQEITKAQPTHKSDWTVCHDTICGQGRARLWLDVDASSPFNDGGFPSPKASLLRSIGIQCFYPQFNARLLPKK
jgi:hypothetical protein